VFTARYVLYSTFYPHSVFMCFVWISEQTASISLYSTDWLVFVTETECVYCAVRSTFYVLPTQCIYVFCVDLRTNSEYFAVLHWLVGFYNRDGVFTARYGLDLYTQLRLKWLTVSRKVTLRSPSFLMTQQKQTVTVSSCQQINIPADWQQKARVS